MLDWWNSLGLTIQVLYCIAVPATLVLLIQTVLTFIGIGDGVDGDIGDAGELPDDAPDMIEPDDFYEAEAGSDAVSGMGGLRLLTFRGIVAFFVVFSWVAIIMLRAGTEMWLTALVSFACGFAIMLLLAYLFKALMGLRSNGNLDNKNAIGTAGKVYLTVPPARGGSGKVNIMLQGAYVERGAVTDEKEAIPTGAEIVVVGVSGQTELVVKRK